MDHFIGSLYSFRLAILLPATSNDLLKEYNPSTPIVPAGNGTDEKMFLVDSGNADHIVSRGGWHRSSTPGVFLPYPKVEQRKHLKTTTTTSSILLNTNV